jgi:hypothetical protein
MQNKIEILSRALLATIAGGFSKSDMPAAAQWIVDAEATRDHSQSTAFGAFKMLEASRRHYMGANWQSTDLQQQYQGATKYINDAYGGSWDKAEAFWKKNGYY